MVTTRRSARLQVELQLHTHTATPSSDVTPSNQPVDEAEDYIAVNIPDESPLLEKDKEQMAIISDDDDSVEYSEPEQDYPSDHEDNNQTVTDSVIDEADDSNKRKTGDNETPEITNEAMNDTDHNTDPQYINKRIKLDRNATDPVAAEHHQHHTSTVTEVQGTDTIRSKFTEMLQSALLQHSPNTDTSIVHERAVAIETAVYGHHHQQCSNEYRHQLRELIGELRSELCSKKLIKQIIDGTVTAQQLITMNFKDLAGGQLKRERSDAAHESISDAILDDSKHNHKDDTYVVLTQGTHDLDTQVFTHGHLHRTIDNDAHAAYNTEGETNTVSDENITITIPSTPQQPPVTAQPFDPLIDPKQHTPIGWTAEPDKPALSTTHFE